jgi:membrane-bound inhibitor of C-type lysozyme
MQTKWQLMMLVAFGISTAAGATDLTIHLKGTEPLSRNTAQYQCDAKGAAMGLPAGVFPVEYINGGGNSLVVVPVHNSSLILANVVSGSGARYAAGPYIWWDAQGSVNFYSDSIAGKVQSACHRVIAK